MPAITNVKGVHVIRPCDRRWTNWLSQGKLEAVQGRLHLPRGPYWAKLYKSLGFYFYEMLHPTFLLKALKNPSPRFGKSHTGGFCGSPGPRYLSNLALPQADRHQSIRKEVTEINAYLLKRQSLFWSRCLVFSKTHLITRLLRF